MHTTESQKPAWSVHICLVSDQPLANLLPLLDEDLRPETVYLIISPSMLKQGRIMAAFIRNLGCTVVESYLPEYSMEVLQNQIEEILTSNKDNKVALNSTGGTKLMALAAFEVVWSRDQSVFYVDTQNECIWHLTEPAQRYPLKDVMRVKSYLRAYGYTVEENNPVSIQPTWREAARTLVEQGDSLRDGMKKINYHAEACRKDLYTTLPTRVALNMSVRQVADIFAQAGLISVDAQGRMLFPDQTALEMVKGGWLEIYTQDVVQQLVKEHKIHDAMAGAVVKSMNGTRNELDVVFCARNRLFLLECKSRNMSAIRVRVDETIYKLESLKHLLGGTFGRAMLVSYYPLEEADKQRCQAANLEFVAGNALKDLKSRLCKWIAQ